MSGWASMSTSSASPTATRRQAAAAGWAGESDWSIVKSEPVEGLSEDEAIDRLAAKERMIDPNLYPKLKGARGVFRINPTKVENHIVVTPGARRRQRHERAEA